MSCESPIDQKDSLPEYLKPVVTFAYHTVWRKEEIPGAHLG